MSNKPEIEKSYLPSEIEEFRKKLDVGFQFSLDTVILFLLHSDSEPIKGKIKQMKEVLLTLNQVFKNQNVQPVHFKKHRYGPYSQAVEHTIDHLVYSNLISIRGKKNTNNFAIELTRKGSEWIKDAYQTLPENIRETLKQKRLRWDTHISQGILKLVYRDHEEFLEKSVIKKRYQKLNWNDDKQRPLD